MHNYIGQSASNPSDSELNFEYSYRLMMITDLWQLDLI